MSGVNKSDIPETAAFMTDFWAFVKKYWIPEDTDSYWLKQHREASEIAKKYDNDKFCEKMLLAYGEYLEEKQGGKRE